MTIPYRPELTEQIEKEKHSKAMSLNITIDCAFCGNSFTVHSKYSGPVDAIPGKGECPTCGLRYEYAEDPVPDTQQLIAYIRKEDQERQDRGAMQ